MCAKNILLSLVFSLVCGPKDKVKKEDKMNRLFPLVMIIIVFALGGFSQLNEASHAPKQSFSQQNNSAAQNQQQMDDIQFFDKNTQVRFNDYINTVQVAADSFNAEAHCLAQAIYFEARSEPVEGQLAVAQVVMNRVGDRRYPSSVCGVVFQNERMRHRCQFSFACDGKSDRPREARAWNLASRISYVAMANNWHDITNSATHYHASYVQPYWVTSMEKTAHYGQHLFYSTVRPSP